MEKEGQKAGKASRDGPGPNIMTECWTTAAAAAHREVTSGNHLSGM